MSLWQQPSVKTQQYKTTNESPEMTPSHIIYILHLLISIHYPRKLACNMYLIKIKKKTALL